MKFSLVAGLAFCASISLLPAQEDVDFFKVTGASPAETKVIQSERLKKLRALRDVAIDRAVAPILEPFRKELQKLKVSFTKAGDLEGALHVKNIEDMADGNPAMKDLDGKAPDGLTELVSRKNAAVDRAAGPIRQTYAEEVAKLVKQATMEGKLAEAIECRNELAAIRGEAPVDAGAGSLPEFSEQFLIGTNWELPQGKEVVLLNFESAEVFRVHKKDAAGKWQPGGTRKWAMEDVGRRQIRIFWHIEERVATLNPKLTEMSDGKNEMTRVEVELSK